MGQQVSKSTASSSNNSPNTVGANGVGTNATANNGGGNDTAGANNAQPVATSGGANNSPSNGGENAAANNAAKAGRGVHVPSSDVPHTKRVYDPAQPTVLPQYFLGRDCLERAQENFQYQRDLAKFNRKCDAAPCATACSHQFSPCRRGCDASFLQNADIFSHVAPSTCQRTYYDRESALLARQLAAYRSGDQRVRNGSIPGQQCTTGACAGPARFPMAAQQVAAQSATLPKPGQPANAANSGGMSNVVTRAMEDQ